MKLEQSFTVRAPPEQVWEALIDVRRVAPCLPGAEVTEADADGTYHGSFNVKIGPATASYRGTLKLEHLDPQARRATMRARGSDKRGQGGVSATIVSEVVPDGEGGTRVAVDTDFTITGRLARFGRGGMIEDVSRRLLGEFAGCLQVTLAHEPSPAPEAAPAMAPPPATPAPDRADPRPHVAARPLNGVKLFFQVLGDLIRRVLGRGGS